MVLNITEASAREAGAAAERLLHDPYLREALEEMISANTQAAITGETAELREAARQQVVAIIQLRGNLAAVFEHWQSAAQRFAAEAARE